MTISADKQVNGKHTPSNTLASFCDTKFSSSKRVCCYGSSSSKTPKAYLDEAYNLGYALAKRGHVCVNGAGGSGCMGYMNQGAADGKGSIVGVIHDMFLIDGKTGHHPVFNDTGIIAGGGYRELQLAGGKDLQERKQKLMTGADAIIVMPGGTGTFDELWEMACARNLGIIKLPIVCVNVNGFYNDFAAMLQRAHADNLLYAEPVDILHFEETSMEAIQWIENELTLSNGENEIKLQLRKEVLKRKPSLLERGLSVFNIDVAFFRDNDERVTKERSIGSNKYPYREVLFFGTGMALGVLMANKRK